MLEIGEKFAGCVVQDLRDSNEGRTWLFVHGNEGIFITVPFSTYFDAISTKHNLEAFLDQLADRINIAIKDHKKISSLDTEN